MKKIDFENKITMYINGELDQQDKINLEKAMDENSNYKNLVDDIIHNDEIGQAYNENGYGDVFCIFST